MPELQLDTLAFGGDAVGRLGGKVVFVPFGVPGDVAEISIEEDHPSYARARIVRLLHPGPGRREPACPLFGACGGCHWLQVDYPTQVAAKHEIFAHSMTEAGVGEIRASTAAPTELGYRRRLRMHWEVQRGRSRVGYYQRGSRTLLDVERCPLLDDVLQEAIPTCRQELERLGEGRGSLVAVADLNDQRVHISLRLDAANQRRAADLAGSFARSPLLAGGQVSGPARTAHCFGAEWINLRLSEEAPLCGGAATFAQANIEQDRLLRLLLGQWLDVRGLRVLELFAGVGNLSLGLAQDAAELVAVEASPASAALLGRNLAPLGGKVRVMACDAVQAARQLAAAGERFDLVVLDPPREGSVAAAQAIGALTPRSVLYVSCDPMTLARDLQQMSKRGLTPARAQALDMLPQTYHIEGLVLLRRGGP